MAHKTPQEQNFERMRDAAYVTPVTPDTTRQARTKNDDARKRAPVVYLSENTNALARSRCRQLKRSFSSYVAALIERDLFGADLPWGNAD